MGFTKGLGLAAAGTAIALLVVVGVAFAGTKTIHDGKDSGVPKCSDIDTVKANAGHRTTKFAIAMFGNVKATPCKGNYLPVVAIDLNRDGNADCSVTYLQGGTKRGLYCGEAKVGKATYAIDPNNDKRWILKFHTSDLPGKPTKFRFVVYSGKDDTKDSAGWAPIKIG